MIYFGGDSHTRGCELQNPDVDCFASLIGKHFNKKIINDALSGGSNHRIIRKFFENINNKIELAIISWTFADRFEHYLPIKGVGSDKDGWRNITPRSNVQLADPKYLSTKKINKVLNSYMIYVRSNEHKAEEFFTQVLTIQKTCKLLNIPLIMTFVHPINKVLENNLDYYKNCYTYPLVDWNNENWLFDKNFSLSCYCRDKKLPFGSRGHFLEEGHRAVSQLFIEKINRENLLK